MMTHPTDRRQRLLLKSKKDEKKKELRLQETKRKARLNALKQRDKEDELREFLP